MYKVGFTTSIPVEVVFAAGHYPVDLNNTFITAKNPLDCIDKAERDGFPRSTCTWIKGIYSSVLDTEDIKTLVGVVEGDCSNTKALLEVLKSQNINTVPFSYPHSKEYNLIYEEILKLCRYFNTDLSTVLKIKKEIDKVRKKVKYLDELTWKENKATGLENHIWQVSTSDFNGEYKTFEKMLDEKIIEIENRDKISDKFRLGYIGVPPIFSDIYEYFENQGGRIVFNEVQRQFSMAHGIDNDDIVEVYKTFTYPYDLESRIEDIKKEIKTRKLDGIVHYTQAFCFRGIEDIILKKELGIPILTIEGDRPQELDSRTKLRIDAFLDMIED